MKLSRRRAGSVDETSSRPFDATLALAKDGNDDALSSLYLDHVAMVYGYLRACRADDPEDLASEVFVGMLRNLHRFDGDHPDFRRWLMTIAHRRLVDHQRRSFRDRSEPAEPLALEMAGAGASPIDLRPVTIDQDLLAAFGQLTDAQREVLALRFVADVSLQDVANIISRPVGAVKSLQNRALAALRRQIRDPRLDEGVTM
jgi:RNA polymerase sigma-70 factor (ECF subfamily)